jgi:hypothetical protein
VTDDEVFGGRIGHGRQAAEAGCEEAALLEEVASVDGMGL